MNKQGPWTRRQFLWGTSAVLHGKAGDVFELIAENFPK
jgi:hypothetical protein